MNDTKSRILDAAESLFAEQGYGATSLRNIIAAAGVNLAAVHYHFGTKEELFAAVVERRAGPVNRERLEMLAQAEREAAAGRLSVERVVEAFLAPAFRRATDPERGAAFRKLLGRIQMESGLLRRVLDKNLAPVIARFGAAFRNALPDVPGEEIAWRMFFASGAMARALMSTEDIEIISGGKVKAYEPEDVMKRLIAFVSAGFRGAVLAVMLAAAGAAQTRGPLELSLRRAVELATSREGNPRVRIAEEGVRQARSRSAQARAALLPDVEASVTQQNITRNIAAFGVRFDAPGFEIPEVVGPFHVFDARGTLTQTVFDFSAIRRYQASKAGADSAREEREAVYDAVASQVARAYVAAQRAGAEVEAAQANVELAQALVRQGEHQRAVGTGTGIEVTRARVQLANEQQRLLVAENDRRRTRLELARAIGLRLDTPVELADPLVYTPVDPTTEEQARMLALETRRDLKAQQEREENARLAASATKLERLPAVRAFGDYGTIGSSIHQSLPTRTLGVSLAIPVFDGGRREARRAESQSQHQAERLRTEDLREQIELEVRLALDALRSAQEQVEVSQAAVGLAQEELASARRRVEAGVVPGLEVTDAQTRLARARDNRIAALYGYELARIELGQATGTVRQMIR
jgi:outer membrane protein